MKKITVYKVNAATPRLSDEELDPLEQDDNEGVPMEMVEGFLVWSVDDISDVHNLIDNFLQPKEKEILCAFIEGFTYIDIGVTEKYWRYHFAKGVDFIKQELGL